MPIPTPNKNETDDDFVQRCMENETMQEYDNDQRLAICKTQIETKDKTMEVKTRNILSIKEDEKTITIVLDKNNLSDSETEADEVDEKDDAESVETIEEEATVEENDHIPGHSEEEEIEEEIEEEEEEEIEEENEYRSKGENVWDKKHTSETRYFNIDSRLDTKEGKDVVIGHAAVFNSLSEDLGGFREKIQPGAFDDVLENDVRAYFNHDPNYLLGRTQAGTLRLSVDNEGLRYELDVPNTTAGQDLKENMRLGNITQSSFAFTIGKEGDSWVRNADGSDVRIIHKVHRLYDVSPVSLPAYPSANDLALAKRSNLIDKENTRKEREQEYEKNTLLKLKINLLKRKK
jgi:HK97 family phage prohead protease